MCITEFMSCRNYIKKENMRKCLKTFICPLLESNIFEKNCLLALSSTFIYWCNEEAGTGWNVCDSKAAIPGNRSHSIISVFMGLTFKMQCCMQAGENTGNKKSRGWRGKEDGERTTKQLICTVCWHLDGSPVTFTAPVTFADPDRHCALHAWVFHI